MEMKYKLRDTKSGIVYTDVKGYLLDKDSNVETIVLGDNTKIPSDNIEFCKFLEEIDGHDVYEGDKAIVELTEKTYDFELDAYTDEETFTVNGTFKELYEEGIYYLVEDGTGKNYVYDTYQPKIKMLN